MATTKQSNKSLSIRLVDGKRAPITCSRKKKPFNETSKRKSRLGKKVPLTQLDLRSVSDESRSCKNKLSRFHSWSSRTLAIRSSLLTLRLDAGSPARDVNFHRLQRPVNLGAGQMNILGSGIHERLEHFIDLLEHNRDLRMNRGSKLRLMEKCHKCRSTTFFYYDQ